MKEKRFRSIIRGVIILPLVVMSAIVIITIVSCVISYQNMEQKMIAGNINSLQIALTQLDNLVCTIDHDFIRYVTTDNNYAFMHTYNRNTPKSEYLRYEAGTLNWLSDLAGSYGDIDGMFAYYQNLDLLLFRGSSNNSTVSVHRYIKEHLDRNDLLYNHLSVVKIRNTNYLLYVRKYGDFCGGCWIPLKNLENKLGLDNSNLLGTVYIIDSQNNNSLLPSQLNSYFKQKGTKIKSVSIASKRYKNYSIESRNEDFYLGMLIPNEWVLINLPISNKIIFIVALFSILLVPRTIYWLKVKIAKPLRELDHAMKIIGKGHSDYRIPLDDQKDHDEFYKLTERFNQMMDELNELEINLYKTQIKEQNTELKYISQQIRPHFILNALNIIYTYDISEFAMAKKMVLYLTKYFRYIVNLKVDFVEVEKEFRHVKTYLQIQGERYLDRLEYFVEWESRVKNYLIPPLIIQTFVENCIKYAMKNNEKLFIFVFASEEDGKLKLIISDTGNGFREEALEKIQRYICTRVYQDGLGVGIQNAIERMDILYQEKVDIKISNASAGGAVVEINLPVST